jgi:hypothetical protein
MKGLLLFLSVAGAAVYGFLVVLHNVLPSANAEYAAVDRTEAPHSAVRNLRSWGPSLSSLVITAQSRPLSSREYAAQPTADERFADASDDKVVTSDDNVADWRSVQKANMGAGTSAQAARTLVSEPVPSKAVSPKSKKRNWSARPARVPGDVVFATSGPSNARWASRGQRRGLGLFLFGRLAAR